MELYLCIYYGKSCPCVNTSVLLIWNITFNFILSSNRGGGTNIGFKIKGGVWYGDRNEYNGG